MTTTIVEPEGNGDPRKKTQQSILASQRAKASPEPNNKDQGRLSKLWPLGNAESLRQWWAAPSAEAAEHGVLSFLEYVKRASDSKQTSNEDLNGFSASEPASVKTAADDVQLEPISKPDPYGDREWHSRSVPLSGENRTLNEFSVERKGEAADQTLVMLHGYGAGLGFFYKNFEGLSRLPGWRLYALDLLGMGRSSRPSFKINAKDRAGRIAEAEDWFIDALEEWRIKKKLDRFTLLGHSLGGYMAVAYALKYPGHLDKLLLASPVGVPEDPRAVNADLPEPDESTLVNEITQDQEEDIQKTSNPKIPDNDKVGDNNNFMNARKHREEAAQGNNASPPPRRPLFKIFAYLWDANVSPFSLVRWSGPLGPRLVSGWTSRRFSHLKAEESQALHTYAYTLMRQRGSGEYALAYILAPGAFARNPLIRRIAGVGRQTLGTSINDSEPEQTVSPRKENGIPIVFIYGENDWMDVAGGFAAEQRLKEERDRVLKTATPEDKQSQNGSEKVLIVRSAGHHVYLDGWQQFNELVRKEMADLPKTGNR